MVKMSTEAFANVGISPLCVLQDCACMNDRACRLSSSAAAHPNLPFCAEHKNTTGHRGDPDDLCPLSAGWCTPLPGGRRSSRVPFQAHTLSIKYQVPIASFSWNGSQGIQHPLPQQKKNLYALPLHIYNFVSQSPVSTWIQHFQFAEFTWGTFFALWNRAVLALMFPSRTKAVVSAKMREPSPALPACPILCLSWATIIASLWTPTTAAV